MNSPWSTKLFCVVVDKGASSTFCTDFSWFGMAMLLYVLSQVAEKIVRNVKITTLIGTTQNNLVDTGRFTRRQKLGKRRYLTFRSKFSKPYDKKTHELAQFRCHIYLAFETYKWHNGFRRQSKEVARLENLRHGFSWKLLSVNFNCVGLVWGCYKKLYLAWHMKNNCNFYPTRGLRK